MYTCPDCQHPLEALRCERCRREYACVDGIPVLLPSHPRYREAVGIAHAYDSIYQKHPNAWESQGKTPEFIAYFARFLGQFPCRRFLEVGSGEGFLLAALDFPEKYGVDLSAQAIRAARDRARARFSLALAERLPFPAGSFDLVTSVGVMEHFLDMAEANREITRVLKPGGHYVALTHVDLTIGERVGLKLSEYVFPRPRPVGFARWMRTRLGRRIEPDYPKQPIQNRYTTRGASAWLEASGLEVIDVVHTRRFPRIPLMGPWVVICVGRKPGGAGSRPRAERAA